MHRILLPLSWLYGLAVLLRHRAYDAGWLTSFQPKVFCLVLGNLHLGGSGKSPMSKWLLSQLSNKYRMAYLSRGYGRNTRGFVEVSNQLSAEACGDEALMMKQFFPDVPVAVCEDRVAGVARLLELYPDLEMVLLDDAFQHRRLKAHLSLCLFDAQSLFEPKCLLPAGRLRDVWSRRFSADALVLTKAEPSQQALALQKLAPSPRQAVFVAQTAPSLPYFYAQPLQALLPEVHPKVLAVCGLARPDYFFRALEAMGFEVERKAFPDHHPYSLLQMESLMRQAAGRPLVITEKDAVKWRLHKLSDAKLQAQLCILPFDFYFSPEESQALLQLIQTSYDGHVSTHRCCA